MAVRNDDEDTFDAEIVSEGRTSPADMFYTENSPALEYLQQKDLLAKVDASTLAKTPAKYNSASGDWVGVSARVSVLIYNPTLIKKADLPTQVLQLALPGTGGSRRSRQARPIFNRLSHRCSTLTGTPPFAG